MPSRQYQEAEARKAQGLCRYCQNPSDRKKNGEFSGLCIDHRKQINTRSLAYYHAKKKPIKVSGDLDYVETEDIA